MQMTDVSAILVALVFHRLKAWSICFLKKLAKVNEKPVSSNRVWVHWPPSLGQISLNLIAPGEQNLVMSAYFWNDFILLNIFPRKL